MASNRLDGASPQERDRVANRKNGMNWLLWVSAGGLIVSLLAWFISYWPMWWRVSARQSIGIERGCISLRTASAAGTTGPMYFPPSSDLFGLEATIVLREWFNIRIYPNRSWDTVWMPGRIVDYYRMPGKRVSSTRLFLPMWISASIFSIAPVARFLRHRRCRRRAAKSLCPECGYDLRGTSGRCPECGSESTAVALSPRVRSTREETKEL